jgi:hypothetical protein
MSMARENGVHRATAGSTAGVWLYYGRPQNSQLTAVEQETACSHTCFVPHIESQNRDRRNWDKDFDSRACITLPMLTTLTHAMQIPCALPRSW